MKQPFAVQLKRYEFWGGLAWLLVYLTVLSLVIELAFQLLGIQDQDDVLLNGTYFFSCFLISAVLFHRFLADSLPGVWQHPGKFLKALVFGFCLYECFEIVLGIGTSAIYPNYTVPNDDTVSSLASANYALIWVGAVLLAPLTEETLVRGFVFGSLRKKNRIAAYVVTALLFAAMHVAAYVTTMDVGSILVNILIYGLPAVALCACYEYGGTIWAPIALHMIINAIGMSAM